MPRGDKSGYTDKQKRQAEHIEEGYERRGVPEREAERRAWATVNAETMAARRAARDAARRKIIRHRAGAASLAERQRPSGRLPSVLARPGRRHGPASAGQHDKERTWVPAKPAATSMTSPSRSS